MKISRYNFINTDITGDEAVIFNARTGALATLNKEKYAQFIGISENHFVLDEEFHQQLFNAGYIVADDVNELNLVKTSMLHARYNSSTMMLTIAPTMACNFRCVYCFEKGQYKNHVMTDETMQSIIQHIKQQANHLDYLSVTWYGGEPTLVIGIITKLSNEILLICEEFNIQYTSTIITNGYLLNKDTTNTLKECHIGSAQITIDGSRNTHDSRRPLADGSGTFDVIMENLKESAGIIPIAIRINTDTDNQDDIKNIILFLKENSLFDKVRLYLGYVLPNNNNYDSEKCMTGEEFSHYNLKFYIENDLPLINWYPSPKGNYCTADHHNAWVIDSYGYLYKCWSDIGIAERRMGSINNGCTVPVNYSRLHDYALFDPTVDEECSECKYLPICMGGCPFNRLSGFYSCVFHKEILNEYIRDCAEMLLETQNENKKVVSV